MRKLVFSLGAAVMLLVGTAHLAAAAEFIGPKDGSGSIMLGNSEVHRNVYTAGQSVTVDSNIQGDLVAAGSNVVLNGGVEDVMVAAGDISINSGARGDIRVIGGTVTISGQVVGDVVVAGGTVHLLETGNVSGDLVVAGGEVTVDGPVAGSARIAGGQVRLNSSIGGDVKVRAENLSIGSGANIQNKISYKGQNEAKVEDGSKISGIDFQKVEGRRGMRHYFGGIFTIGFVMKLLAGIAAGLLLMKLFPRTANRTVGHIQSHPWSDLGIGFLGMVIVPICALILLVTFVGYYIAALAFFGYIFLLLVACVAASIFAGALVVKLLTKKPNLVVDWQALVIGVVVVGILGFIPVVGWLAVAVLSLMAVGALLRLLKGSIDHEQGGQISAGATELPLNN